MQRKGRDEHKAAARLSSGDLPLSHEKHSLISKHPKRSQSREAEERQDEQE